MKRAILFIIDACRADALDYASTPHIDTLIDRGAATFSASTVSPPLTLPVHYSVFTSLKPINHDVLTNVGRPYHPCLAPSIMDLAKYNGKTTAAFYSWNQLGNLWMPGSVDHTLCINTVEDPDHDLKIAAAARSHISMKKPDFCYIYLERTDYMGHREGFMSDPYLSAIEKADKAVGVILSGLRDSGLMEKYHIILHSDHGGIGFHHTEDRPEVTTIPWIAAGPDIQSGYRIDQSVTVLDTTPTLATLLGIRPHHNWEGKVVDIFSERDLDNFAILAA